MSRRDFRRARHHHGASSVVDEDERLKTYTPDAIVAMTRIAYLHPGQGESGTIECPRCGRKTLNYLRERVSGKTSGACSSCNLRVPRY